MTFEAFALDLTRIIVKGAAWPVALLVAVLILRPVLDGYLAYLNAKLRKGRDNYP